MRLIRLASIAVPPLVALAGWGSPALAAPTSLQVAGVTTVAVDRGNYAVVPVTVRNSSRVTVSHIRVTLAAAEGLEPVAGYTNCTTNHDNNTAVCVVDQELAPGATATVSTARNPLMLKVQEDAGGPFTYAATVTAAAVPDSASSGTGPTLSLEPTSAKADNYHAEAKFGITVSSSSPELTAVGAAINGKFGDTTTVRVGLANAGPTATVPGTTHTARVTMPSGVEVTETPEGCTAVGASYTCTTTRRLRPSQSELFTFTAKIVSDSPTAGTVVTSTNDTAEITRLNPVSGTSTLPTAGAASSLLLAAGAAVLLITRRRPTRPQKPPNR
jgi:hypothetical protein